MPNKKRRPRRRLHFFVAIDQHHCYTCLHICPTNNERRIKMALSRRDLMKNAGMLAAATGFGGLPLSLAGSAAAQVAEKQAALPDLPWPYKKLDPAVVAEEAYAGYYKGACGYGVFEGIVG